MWDSCVVPQESHCSTDGFLAQFERRVAVFVGKVDGALAVLDVEFEADFPFHIGPSAGQQRPHDRVVVD